MRTIHSSDTERILHFLCKVDALQAASEAMCNGWTQAENLYRDGGGWVLTLVR